MKTLCVVLICHDGTELVSRHRHDYKTVDIDGISYMIDGGGQPYCRHSGKGKLKLITTESLISEIREYFMWGRNYSGGGSLLPTTQYILLKDLSDSHLKALVEYMANTDDEEIKTLFTRETLHRIKHKISVNDYKD